MLALAVPVGVVSLAARQDSTRESQSWPAWRGPLATGEAIAADPPVSWSESHNIRWKVEIPGHGSASPVVWGDRIFVLTAIPAGDSGVDEGFLRGLARRFVGTVAARDTLRFVVLAFDRRDGSLVWERVAREEAPHQGRHQTGSWASPSAVTDGDVLCAFFGSRGLYCYDLDGRPLWDRDFGDMRVHLGFGEGASPVLHRDTIVIAWDHEDGSFITALDTRTGRERWRVARDEETSWATPLIVEHEGRAQVVTSASRRVRSYALDTGRLIWEAAGVDSFAIPSPVSAAGLVHVVSRERLDTIRLDGASGDLTGTGAVLWSVSRDTPYVPSPLLAGGILHLVKGHTGILSGYDARTGQVVYGPRRIPGVRDVYASPVAAGGRIYVTSRDGTTAVLAADPPWEVLSVNMLEDGFDASPAVVAGDLYLRGQRFLYRIAAD
jgi:outer membrane protein assembly factor BamB